MSCIDNIRNEIINKYEGDAFTANDFLSYGQHDAVRQALTRLTKEGSIRRVLHGVYDKPIYSTILKEFSAPSPHKVALALARKYNWQISISGDAALNMLGLSTQIPAKWDYVSSGPYKKFIIGTIIIEFHHRSDTQMVSKSSKTLLIIQALKKLRTDSNREEMIINIKNILSSKEKKRLLRESNAVPFWMHKTIKSICNNEE